MRVRIATSIVLLLLIARSSACADVLSVIESSQKVFEKQRSTKLLSERAFSIAISQQTKNDKFEENHLCVFGKELGTGVHASYTKGASLYVELVNPEYGAVARTSRRANLGSAFALSSLKDRSFSLDTYWRKDAQTKHWLEDSVQMQMTSRYFNFGNTDFPKAVNATIERGGKFDFEEAGGNRKLHELRFANWPVENEMMTYRIDPVTFAICEIEAKFDRIQSKLEVLEFVDLNGVAFPQKLVLNNKLSSGESLVKRSEWREVSLESVDFNPEQLYLPYYGLSNPDLGELPKAKGSGIYLYLLLGLVFLVVAWVIKKRVTQT